MTEPKNIAQLKPTQRAIADQSIREAMLAIVHAQGRPVRIPIADLNEIAKHSRLILEVDHKAGVVILTAEKFAAEIIKGTVKLAKPVSSALVGIDFGTDPGTVVIGGEVVGTLKPN